MGVPIGRHCVRIVGCEIEQSLLRRELYLGFTQLFNPI